MGAGKGSLKRINANIIFKKNKPLENSFINRGWRFFYWENHNADGEIEVDTDHDLIKGLERIEIALFNKLKEKGIEPVDNMDLCFFEKQPPLYIEEDKEVGGTMAPNVDGRLQMSLWLGQEDFNDALHSFLHEYYHALQFEYLFGKNNHSGRNKEESKAASKKFMNTFPHPVSEALADTFPIRMMNGGRIWIMNDIQKLLPYQRLKASTKYEDAISLKMFFNDCIAGKVTSTDNKKISNGQFYYDCLKGIRENPGTNVWNILEKSFIDNKYGNLEKLYEDWRIDKQSR